MTPELLVSIKLFAPEWILLAGLCFLFVLDSVFSSSRLSQLPLWVVLFTCILGGLISMGGIPTESTPLFSGALVSDGLLGFFRCFFFFASAACAILAF